MKKWKVIAPLGLAAVGALAAGVATLVRKPEAEKAAPAAGPDNGPTAPIKNPKTGSYSFISGYKDAATVELSLQYDPEKFSFSILSEEFPAYSGDSHVAVLFGEDFTVQIEYAAYYQGEDFDALVRELTEKYAGLVPVSYGALAGVQYQEGDNICLAFPVPGDGYSYVLVTLIKAAGNDDELASLPAHPDLTAMLNTLRFA